MRSRERSTLRWSDDTTQAPGIDELAAQILLNPSDSVGVQGIQGDGEGIQVSRCLREGRERDAPSADSSIVSSLRKDVQSQVQVVARCLCDDQLEVIDLEGHIETHPEPSRR